MQLIRFRLGAVGTNYSCVVKSGLHCTDEAQNKAETYVCSYLAPCKKNFS